MKQRKPWSKWELRDLPRSWRENVVEAKPKGKKRKTRKKSQEKDKAEKSPESKGEFDGDFIRPMRGIVEVSWQSGRDV